VFILLPQGARQLYPIENQQPPGNPVTAAVFSAVIKQNTVFPGVSSYSLKYSISK
jgi:hypothetical protein